MRFDAIVLAGGRGRRLGGADKALVEVGRRSLLARSLEAAGEAERVIVVGPRRPAPEHVLWTREEPPGGGPAAALGAGIRLVRAEVVVTLAVDLPLVDGDLVADLLSEVGEADGAIVTNGNGRDQPLAGAYRSGVLRRRLDDLAPLEGKPVALVVAPFDLHRKVSALTTDCDTWAAVAAADRLLGGG